ncbi:MAG: chemotaxis protein CheX [Campylobacterota bacterium]|nr:chemotaxis protein CheX [Campylobacterota bacterium]
MLQTIQTASENFCIHQIRAEHTVIDGVSKKRTFIAYIDIDANDTKKYRVYIASDEAFMQRVSMLFLEEDESDEETLIDMTLETANLIIGSAKVIAEAENENTYTINTPFFEKLGEFDFEYDSAKTITVDEDELTIAIKELDG